MYKPSLVHDSGSMEGLVLSVSHRCSSLQSVVLLVSMCRPQFVHVCCLCAMATAQGARGVSFQKAQCRIDWGCLALNCVSSGLCLLLRLRAPKEIVFLCADEGTIVPCSLRSPALVQYRSAELQVPVPTAADQCCCLLRLCPSSQLHLLQLN